MIKNVHAAVDDFERLHLNTVNTNVHEDVRPAADPEPVTGWITYCITRNKTPVRTHRAS